MKWQDFIRELSSLFRKENNRLKELCKVPLDHMKSQPVRLEELWEYNFSSQPKGVQYQLGSGASFQTVRAYSPEVPI